MTYHRDFDEFKEWLVSVQMTKEDLETLITDEHTSHIYLLRGMHGSNYGPPGADFGWSAEESAVRKRGHTPVTKWAVNSI